MFVDNHIDSISCSTNRNTQIILSGRNSICQRMTIIRIIHRRIFSRTTEVSYIILLPDQKFKDFLLKEKTCMVGNHNYLLLFQIIIICRS